MNKALQLNGLDETNRISLDKMSEPKVSGNPVTGERYHSKKLMRKEWDHVWTKTWLIAGLEEELVEAGDRITFDIGHESILCTKDKEGTIRTFYNVCQHRGNKLVHEEWSNGKQMQCNYHGWRFAADGELTFIPNKEDFAEGNPCGKLRLKELPCRVWAGFIWYSMDENVIPLEDYLGPVYHQIDCYDLKRMKRTHWVTIEGDFNWKVVQDNFNESYHLPYVHPQTMHFMEQSYQHCQMDIFEKEGHARMFMPGARPTMGLKGNYDETITYMQADFDFWGLDSETFRKDPHSMREAMQKVKRKKGPEKGFDYSRMHDDQLTDHFHYTIFPNLSLSLKPDGCIFLKANPHPTDPTKCYFDMWYLTWFPDGTTEYFSGAMQESVGWDVKVPHITGKYPETSCGPGIDQDVSIWNSQQLGLMSAGYDGSYLPDQEKRVGFFHDELDRYIARGEEKE